MPVFKKVIHLIILDRSCAGFRYHVVHSWNNYFFKVSWQCPSYLGQLYLWSTGLHPMWLSVLDLGDLICSSRPVRHFEDCGWRCVVLPWSSVYYRCFEIYTCWSCGFDENDRGHVYLPLAVPFPWRHPRYVQVILQKDACLVWLIFCWSNLN